MKYLTALFYATCLLLGILIGIVWNPSLHQPKPVTIEKDDGWTPWGPVHLISVDFRELFVQDRCNTNTGIAEMRKVEIK